MLCLVTLAAVLFFGLLPPVAGGGCMWAERPAPVRRAMPPDTDGSRDGGLSHLRVLKAFGV